MHLFWDEGMAGADESHGCRAGTVHIGATPACITKSLHPSCISNAHWSNPIMPCHSWQISLLDVSHICNFWICYEKNAPPKNYWNLFEKLSQLLRKFLVITLCEFLPLSCLPKCFTPGLIPAYQHHSKAAIVHTLITNSFYIWQLSAATVHQFLLASPPSDKVGGRLETGASGGLAGVSGNGSGNTIRPSLLLLLGLFSRYTKHCTPLHGTAK